MFRTRRAKRKLKKMGKQHFNFDYNLEKNIYCNLCAYPLKFTYKNLPSHLQFESYHQWKQYIEAKYNKYDKACLIEFKKYINQLVRLATPIKEYWEITITALLSSFFTTLVSSIVNFVSDENRVIQGKNLLSFILYMINSSLFIIFVSPIIILIILITLKPLLTDKMEISFLKDYHKIIKKLIKDKTF